MRLATIAFLFSLTFLASTQLNAQHSSTKQDDTKKTPESKVPARDVQAGSVTINMPEGMTQQQADAMLNELRQIRQLLEKQQTQLEHIIFPQAPSVGNAPPGRLQMKVEKGWNSLGRADAPITVVEFTDYECPYCKRFHRGAFAEIKRRYIDTGKVRWVTRDLPLGMHPHALKAAQAVRCAGDQGKYWELYDALLSNDPAPTDDVIEKLAENLSLDIKNFLGCLGSQKYISDVQNDSNEAAALKISGTPSFVLAKTSQDQLDGILFVGTQSYAGFDSAIQQVLKASAPGINGKTNCAE